MTVSTQHDIMFRLPEDWRDRSVQIFVAPTQGVSAPPPSFVATRDPLAPGQTLQQYAEKALHDAAQKFGGFELLERTRPTLGNRGGFGIHFRWHSPHGPLVQRQVFLPGDFDTVVCLTATCLAADFPTASSVFDAIFQSVRMPDPY